MSGVHEGPRNKQQYERFSKLHTFLVFWDKIAFFFFGKSMRSFSGILENKYAFYTLCFVVKTFKHI